MATRRELTLPLIALLLCPLPLSSACMGSIGDAGADPGSRGSGARGGAHDDDDQPYGRGVACIEGEVPDADLLRIDRDTYVAALRGVFGDALVDAVGSSVSAVPTTQDGQYGSQLAAPSLAVVTAYLDLASALAFEATADAAHLSALRPCLAELETVADAGDEPCLVALVDDFGRQLTRRPLTDEDRARFLGAYGVGGVDSVANGVATMLMEMLMDPRFLYHVEIDGEETRPGVLRLTSHELAARLARVLWSATPDEELRAAADAGLEGEILAQQVQRMWEDERAHVAMRGFYADWLELDGTDAEVEGALLDFTQILTFERDASFADLLLDPTAVVSSERLADVYGLSPDVRGVVELPSDQRAGLLTRAGWLATAPLPGTNAGHIIHRGDRLGRFTCNALPPPDPGLLPAEDPAQADGAASGIRDRFWEVTSEPQCASCHQRLDAFGAPFGHFGADGGWIDVETIERGGEAALEFVIDATSSINLDGAEHEVSGAIELSRALAESPSAAACMAQHVTQSVVGRRLRRSDACLVQTASDILAAPDASPRSVRDAILTLLTGEEFVSRSMPEGE